MIEVWFKKLTVYSAEIIPETIEDIVFLRSYIRSGDLVSAKTVRTIKIEKVFSRHAEKERKTVLITVKTEKVSFEGSFDLIRVKGQIQGASDENITAGSTHNLEICPDTRFLYVRGESPIDFKLLEETTGYDKFMLISLDSMVAGIGKIVGSRVEYVAEVQSNYQGKLYDVKQESYTVFFKDILEVISPLLKDFSKIIVSGPGHLKLNLKNYFEGMPGEKEKPTVSVLEGIDTSGFDGIRMALNSEGFSNMMKDNFFSKARTYMNQIMSSLYRDNGLASASLEEIERFSSMGASESLLILKDYLSKLEDEEKLTSIFSNITRYKGRICFLDNKTNTGIQLESLGGIAVLLRYKIK